MQRRENQCGKLKCLFMLRLSKNQWLFNHYQVAPALTRFLRERQLFLLTLPRGGAVNLAHEKKYKRSFMTTTMKRVLVPLDLMRSPCDALVYARNMAADSPVCVTLLYVLNLNIVPPGRQIYDELC